MAEGIVSDGGDLVMFGLFTRRGGSSHEWELGWIAIGVGVGLSALA